MAQIYFTDGSELPVSNIYCIGRNYAAHAAELNNPLEPEPLVFIKPTSAILQECQDIQLPAFSSDVHFECELVLVVGRGGKHIAEDTALDHIAGYGVGLDLTARDLQAVAKQKGSPWTLAKGFDGAACLSRFLPRDTLANPATCRFSLDINGQRRQSGDCSQMLHPLPRLITLLSRYFSLQAGDLIYTGTPEGVGPLHAGDRLLLDLAGQLKAEFKVAG
jgi:2-keto-4-pentenoate hydratase/2-oxohepta-3-ene-1,7-dioic acid hydratase in catechol pathway